MKRLLIFLTFLLISLPTFSMEIYNDREYSYQVDSVMFTERGRELLYTLYVVPLVNAQINDRYYKALVSQKIYNGYTSITQMYTLDKYGSYLHTDNTKDFIRTKINSYSATFINNIQNSFTNCEEKTMYLYCTPKK